ncbi:MAG: L-aspartate oxidase [Lachnospiraceae bacterium]|nr:L-aspartate oxidase [Lachnospiraceae bacterium]
MAKNIYCDVVIAGCGVSGLYTALNLPPKTKILMLCKEDLESCDSMLAQGGICVLRDEQDYEAFFEDTMKAGHYENRRESVDIMIRSSRDIINHLLELGVRFDRNPDGSLQYTREGAHSRPRICFHEDITGREITTRLQEQVRSLPGVTIMEHTVMTDILTVKNRCGGIIATAPDGAILHIHAHDTVMATGGIGGLYEHSTNYPCLTGDALEIAEKHHIELEHPDYVQIHPTSLYSEKPGRSFLISESARGEGAVLLNQKGERFVNELLPRDMVTRAILQEMKKEGTTHVWLSFATVSRDIIQNHFPHIYEKCLEEGYDITRQPIPVIPAQHYFMGGIHVDSNSETTMDHLYAVGETSCNGVHGKNRLASNSLLESLVFAKRAAAHITDRKRKGIENHESSYHAACC